MPAETDFDAEQGFWTILCREPFRVEDVRAATQVMKSGRHGPPTGNALWDVRQIDLASVQVRHMRQVIDGPSVPGHDRGRARIAILVGSTVGYGVARMYQAYADEMAQVIQVFDDLEKAHAWLREEQEPA